MHTRKRSASDAQLPLTVDHQHKRPVYTHTLPSRRNTHGGLLEDAPEGHSLLTRWVTLFNDTFHALWDKSADFASECLG